MQSIVEARQHLSTLHESRLARAILAILVGWALMWGAFQQLRGPFHVTGTIDRTFIDKFNGYPLARFAVTMRSSDGNRVTIRHLYGECLAARRGWGTGRTCSKAEFPVGAAIEVDGYSIWRDNLCRTPLTKYRCRPTALDQISTIRVNGQEVTSGWFGSFAVPSLYLLWAAAIAWLALNEWQIRAVTPLGLIGCVLLLQACLLVL